LPGRAVSAAEHIMMVLQVIERAVMHRTIRVELHNYGRQEVRKKNKNAKLFFKFSVATLWISSAIK